ncbi:hypothetical protein V3W47_16525 [Deinococcus sp. YIM 134068]|uniref:hypothetical protein n=1 Tax=Deinococcus lichenicola TaxID=3118910 RepID=UPI002F9599FC
MTATPKSGSPEPQVSGLYSPLFLQGLYTTLEDCLTLTSGSVDLERLVALESRRYDHAPLLDANRRVVGVIYTKTARERFETGQPLEERDAELTWVHEHTTLDGLLTSMSMRRAVLVAGDMVDGSVSTPNLVGLFTLSDFNLHTFRARLYSLLADLETHLAELMQVVYDDPWTWLEWLPEGQRVGVVGSWELSKRAGVDLSPVHALNLTQLVTVVASSKELRGQLGFSSRRKFDELTGGIPDLRNRVMHPVRHLVMRQEDVTALHKTAAAVCSLRDIVAGVLAKMG